MGRCAIGLILVIVTGCTYVNKPLNAPNVPVDRRVRNATRASVLHVPATRPALPALNGVAGPTTLPRDDGHFVGIAISGGGLRSANFSAACMFQLQRLGLLDHVDYISSVSGG